MIDLMIAMTMLFIGFGFIFNTPILNGFLVRTIVGNFWINKIGLKKAEFVHRWVIGPLMAVVGVTVFLSVSGIV